MLHKSFLLAGILMFQNIYSQKPASTYNFYPPLDIPLYLSGNFGEIRPGHFHSGLDFKTQGVTGKKVYSINEGYVSRIKIQTNGYGNSIYITHPGGITSVYAHLERYNDSIAGYVRSCQYQRKSHTLDIYPDKKLFPVSKGQVIALSGNTGGSAGPHLHFELRGSSSQHILNGLLYGFNIKDKIPPKISNLYIYPLGETPPGKYAEPKQISLKLINGKYHLNNSDTIVLKGSIGFGIDAIDLLDDISNQCAVYSIELSVDSQAVYLFRMDEFSFEESPFVDAYSDYYALTQNKKKISLLYRKPNNQLSLYPLLVNNGIVNFRPETISKVDIKVKDAYGNTSLLNFYVKGSAPSVMLPGPDSATERIFKWNSPNYFENAYLRLYIPQNSLYDDIIFNYSFSNSKLQSTYPLKHYVGDRFIPLYKPADISISGEGIPYGLRKKTMVAIVEDDNSTTCLTSSWNGNWITAKANRLGVFTLITDTIAPEIVPLNIKPGINMQGQSSIKFKISDSLSGIVDYQGFIDNLWVLFEYDPKNELISYNFDKERLAAGKEHELELYITDAAGNRKLYHSRFIW